MWRGIRPALAAAQPGSSTTGVAGSVPIHRYLEVIMWKRLSLLLALPLLLLAACDAAPPLAPGSDALLNQGQGLFRIESPMFPFYSRTELATGGGFGYRTDEWAAIVFYRDPGCIPSDFNLFEFYDIPGAFGCTPVTVDGFGLFTEPLGQTPPKLSNLNGDAVPIWFVPWDVPFQQAVEDEVLTMAQLEAMPGLVKGVATQFREIVQTIENHPSPKINLTARGYILPESGGGSFRYNVNWSGLTVGDVKNVKIRLQP